MSEFKVDQDFMELVSRKTLGLVDFISEQCKTITDEKEDIFVRYLSYIRLKYMMKSVACSMESFKQVIADGHNLNHPFFHTDKYKEGGWDNIKLDKIEFFCNEKQENKDMPGH